MKRPILILLAALFASPAPAADEPAIRHSFLTLGRNTAIVGEDGQALWEYKGGTRDGFVLPNGNVLLVWKNRAEEVTRDKTVVVFS